MESDEVAADNVRRTGDNDIRARNIKIEDLNVFTPVINNVELLNGRKKRET